YYPYGRNNMLEVAFLVSHLLWMTTQSDMEILYDMITVNAAKAIGLSSYKLAVGSTASLVVLDVPRVVDAFRFHRAPKFVINHGRVIAKSGVLI
ncbi:MAG: amidohydrolase family protein, partial [Anaerolineales bacterium]|nr:amidohydrolase family protein [Anaerolineales bacterium]